jgi:prepilin-type N-terminal cleavage/methylation domain-containing protein/prepilin-type processing-associated H-X9-DG protein
MDRSPTRSDRRSRRGFTLTELMVVIGLIAMLVALFLPVLRKVRAAANTTVCLSNLRQMGSAWQLYVAENRGRLITFVQSSPPQTPSLAYDLYWPAIVERAGIRGSAAFCPVATEFSATGTRRGYGGARLAWSGQPASNGTAVRVSAKTFRTGSYGYNRYLTVDGGFAKSNRVAGFPGGLSDVPVLMDCAYVDLMPQNMTPDSVTYPIDPSGKVDLTGKLAVPGAAEHWKILIARHGRGINVYMADGTARWVRLEDLYQLAWRANWQKFRLDLTPPQPRPAAQR